MVDNYGSDKLSDRGKSSWDLWGQEVKQYQQAKEKVMFEGFEGDYRLFFWDKRELYTIEDVVAWNPTLTQAAIKKLGL